MIFSSRALYERAVLRRMIGVLLAVCVGISVDAAAQTRYVLSGKIVTMDAAPCELASVTPSLIGLPGSLLDEIKPSFWNW